MIKKFTTAIFAALLLIAGATCAYADYTIGGTTVSLGALPSYYPGQQVGLKINAADGALLVYDLAAGGGGGGGCTSPCTVNQGTSPWVSSIPGGVIANPPVANSGTPTQTTGACTTSSSTVLAASAASSSETFHLPSGAANPVWLNFAGAAATAAAPNFDLQPGASITFTAVGGLLPTAAVTCIASASTSVTEIYK